MEHFLIVVNRHKDRNLETADFIKNYLEEHHKECRICLEEEKSLQAARQLKADCVLVLGGDGTLLQTAGELIGQGIPLLGINLGTLGYLAEVEKNGVEDALRRLLTGAYEVEKRMMLRGRILRASVLQGQSFHEKTFHERIYHERTSGGMACNTDGCPDILSAEGDAPEEAFALNDITITRCGSLRIIKYQLYVRGMALNSYEGDGIIVATPTGSTGYNMSAGGPVVEPKAELILVTPVCPHTLNTRSIILSASDQIAIEVAPDREGNVQQVEVNFDGSHKFALSTGDRVEIERAEPTTDIIKLNNVSFLEILNKKMSE